MIYLLSFIFLLSGFASIIYQIVWQRLLTVYYGSGAVSVALIVSLFMAGLGFGALVGGKYVERVKNRFQLYCIVELLIGLFGLISLFFLNILGQATAGCDYWVAFLCMSLFLFIPTFLMGTTLPILIKIFNKLVNDFDKAISYLYFINTLGAAGGAVCASYVLISFFGLDAALYVAASINLILAFMIFKVRRYTPVSPKEKRPVNPISFRRSLGKLSYALVFVTGFLAIGYEIVWFRLIGVIIKGSSYAFSSMLCVYLLGVAIGSYLLGLCLQRRPSLDRKHLFFKLQFCLSLLVAAIIISYFYLTDLTSFADLTRTSFKITLHPHPGFVELKGWGALKTFLTNSYAKLDVFTWPLLFLFLPTMIMGASFPLMTSLALDNELKEGQTVGVVYFFNILGNVCGGLVTGFLLLDLLGTERTLLVFICIGLLFGLFMARSRKTMVRITVMALAGCIFYFFPQQMQLYRLIHPPKYNEDFTSYYNEGRDGVVATFANKQFMYNYINGTLHGGRPGIKYYRQALEAIAFTPKYERVLIIGLGTGSTVEALLKLSDVQQLTLVEINETLVKNLQKIKELDPMFNDARVDVVIEDGRRYLLQTEEKFDLIMIDPLRTTTGYSNNLYSKDFYEIAKNRLNNEGVFFVWTDEYNLMPKTVASVFDHVRFYKEKKGGFFLASLVELSRSKTNMLKFLHNYDVKDQKFLSEDYPEFVANKAQIDRLAVNLPANSDLRPHCEYYLGLQFKKRHFRDPQ